MVDPELVATILALGAALPLLTSVVQQPQWSASVRTWSSVAVSILAGLVAYVTQFGLDFSAPSTVVSTVIGVVLASAASYKTIWKPSGVAAAIENSTSPHKDYED